jgi:hypothetical protein
MAQGQTGVIEYPLMNEGWQKIRILSAQRQDSKFGVQLALTVRWINDPENPNSQWNTWLPVRKGGTFRPEDLIPKMIAACRGLAELPENVTFDDELEPIDKEIEVLIAHHTKGEKSTNPGSKSFKFTEFRPAPTAKIGEDEVTKIKAAMKKVYAGLADDEYLEKVKDVLKKALKSEEAKKVADLSPEEAKLVWARLEALAEAKEITLER